MRILVVDDEVDLADSIARGLKREQYAVDLAYSGEEALEKIYLAGYDLICLDVTMPGISGVEVTEKIRKNPPENGHPRILMLTALGDIGDRVSGLDSGADDYLAKPFDYSELLARVRALLRRDTDIVDTNINLGDIQLDLKKFKVTRNSKDGDVDVPLSNKEFTLLQFFMTNPGSVFSQEQLLEHNWGEETDPFTHTVRVTVGNLRRKLNKASDMVSIETVVGRGYRLIEK